MLELKRCKICGKEIGNVYDTDLFCVDFEAVLFRV